jgi:hypothetical protein
MPDKKSLLFSRCFMDDFFHCRDAETQREIDYLLCLGAVFQTTEGVMLERFFLQTSNRSAVYIAPSLRLPFAPSPRLRALDFLYLPE